MFSLFLAITLHTVLASAAYTSQMVDCEFTNDTLNVYQHPNASTSYSIPAIVSNGNTVTNSSNKSWQIINSIGNVSKAFYGDPPQDDQLSQYIFLDTSSTINTSSLPSPLPFAGCQFAFAMPSSYNGKTSSDGSCGKIFGQSCLNDIMSLARDKTAAIPSTLASSTLLDACDTVSETINNYLMTSSKVCSKDGPTIWLSQGINFSYPIIDNCTTPPLTTPLPITLMERHYPFAPGNNTIYDQWTTTAAPLLIAVFSNATALINNDRFDTLGDAPFFSQTYLTCTNPAKGGATSAADRAVVMKSGVVGLALAVNALMFFMLS